MDLSLKTPKKLRLEDFLRQNLDAAPAPRIIDWVDRDKGIFRILWTHQSSGSFRHDDAALFRYWAIARGKSSQLSSVELKQGLRMALNKSPSVQRLPTLTQTPDYRYFCFTGSKASRESSKRQSEFNVSSNHLGNQYHTKENPITKEDAITKEAPITPASSLCDEKYLYQYTVPDSYISSDVASSPEDTFNRKGKEKTLFRPYLINSNDHSPKSNLGWTGSHFVNSRNPHEYASIEFQTGSSSSEEEAAHFHSYEAIKQSKDEIMYFNEESQFTSQTCPRVLPINKQNFDGRQEHLHYLDSMYHKEPALHHELIRRQDSFEHKQLMSNHEVTHFATPMCTEYVIAKICRSNPTL